MRALSDRGAVALAVCAAGGALVHRAVPLPIAVVAIAVSFLVRRPVLLCIGAALLVPGTPAGGESPLRGTKTRSPSLTFRARLIWSTSASAVGPPAAFNTSATRAPAASL